MRISNGFREFTMRHRVTSSLGVLVATLTVLPNVLAQKGSRSRPTRPPAVVPAAAAPLSHDLSGIWMQYADGTEPGFARMNGVDDRVRPSLAPWGQAKFDTAKPLMGPRAVGGAEDSAALHCEPSGPPQLLILPNPFEFVQIPGRVFMFFEELHIWRTIWTDRSEEHTSELQSHLNLVCRLLLEKKKKK